MALLLNKTAVYCKKLENIIFDFVCLEEIKETFDPLLDSLKPFEMTTDWTRVPPGAGQPRKIRTSYSYDYQCLRSGGRINEKRILLMENGRKTHVPNAVLKTTTLRYGNALLAPVSLFGEQYQFSYDYSIVGKAKIGDISVVVVEAKPRPNSVDPKCSFGRAWFDPATADVLRIEWSDTHVGNWELFEKRGERFLRTPRLRMRAELIVEKNGFRFPKALSIEEAYVDEKGRAFVRSKIDVTYKDFKFFTVEVAVK